MNEEFRELRIKKGESEDKIADILNLSVDEYRDKEEGHVSLTNHEKMILEHHFNLND